jgi:uncharacterized membrane protein YkgB
MDRNPNHSRKSRGGRDRRSRTNRLTGADMIAVAVGLTALLAGVVLLVATSDYTIAIVGAGLLGVAGIAFVALAFLMVGESEDRDYRKGAL